MLGTVVGLVALVHLRLGEFLRKAAEIYPPHPCRADLDFPLLGRYAALMPSGSSFVDADGDGA